MYEGINISTPFTESWVAWLMLLLLIGLCLVNIFQPGLYLRAFASIFTTKERDSIFVGSGSDNRSKAVLVTYDILLLGLTMQWLLFGQQSWSIVTFLILCGCAAAMLVVRFFMQQLVAFTFFGRSELETFSRHYHYLFICIMLLVYPITLASLFIPWSAIIPIASVILYILVACFVGLLLYKLIACFQPSAKAIFYLPLYVVTVELLPIAAMVVAAKSLI